LGTKELIKLKLGSPLSRDVIRKKKGKRNFTNHCSILLSNLLDANQTITSRFLHDILKKKVEWLRSIQISAQ
jgi:hypothetical protein